MCKQQQCPTCSELIDIRGFDAHCVECENSFDEWAESVNAEMDEEEN